ncbi:hypothetical protein B0H14DRAFT_2183430, partial [Mycena olivaceomarginata]
VECQNILGEHPEWSRGPRGLRLPIWRDTAGDVSSKIDHITPTSGKETYTSKMCPRRLPGWLVGASLSINL